MEPGARDADGLTIRLRINGVDRTLNVQPWVTLLDLCAKGWI